jgi:hypothetical protein
MKNREIKGQKRKLKVKTRTKNRIRNRKKKVRKHETRNTKHINMQFA